MIEAFFEVWNRLTDEFGITGYIILILAVVAFGSSWLAVYILNKFIDVSTTSASALEESADLHEDNNKKLTDMHIDMAVLKGMMQMLVGADKARSNSVGNGE